MSPVLHSKADVIPTLLHSSLMTQKEEERNLFIYLFLTPPLLPPSVCPLHPQAEECGIVWLVLMETSSEEETKTQV